VSINSEEVRRRNFKRSIHGLLVQYAVKIGAILALVICCSLGAASAEEAPRLVASGVFGTMFGCGNSSLIASVRGAGSVWINLLDGRRVRFDEALPSSKQAYVMHVLACSSDGRWVVVQYLRFEEGDPTCASLGGNLPIIVVWDTLRKSHSAIGRGYFSFSISPDGSRLIYYRRMICDLDKDKRTSIEISLLAANFKTISGDEIVRKARPARNAGGLGVAAIRWIEPDRLVAHLAEKEGDEGGYAGGGALTLMSRVSSSDVLVAQLNPARFGPHEPWTNRSWLKTSLKLYCRRQAARSSVKMTNKRANTSLARTTAQCRVHRYRLIRAPIALEIN
jgi:hypothetical protein